MLATTLFTTLLATATTVLAARPAVQLFNTANCQAGTEDGTFGPIPTNVCQVINGSPNANAFGASIQGNVNPGCRYRFFTRTDCTSPDGNFFEVTPSWPANQCFHVRDNEPVKSVILLGGTACN